MLTRLRYPKGMQIAMQTMIPIEITNFRSTHKGRVRNDLRGNQSKRQRNDTQETNKKDALCWSFSHQ